MYDGNPNFNEYPERVTLCFRNKGDRDWLMGHLSDGFGENFCDLDWPWANLPRGPQGETLGFEEQERFAVTVFRFEDADD